MSPRRRNTDTVRAIRAGAELHDLLIVAHHEATGYEGPGGYEGPDSMAAVLVVVIRQLLDGQAPEAVLIAAATTWRRVTARADRARARAAALAEQRQAGAEQARRRLSAVVNTYPCPACQATAGQPCVTLSPARRPKPVTGLHALRLRLADQPTHTEEGATA